MATCRRATKLVTPSSSHCRASFLFCCCERCAGGKRRAAHSQDSCLIGGTAKNLCRTRIESTPRGLSTRRTIVFRPTLRLAVFSDKATLRWMRNVPGSFRDFPAPRSAAHCRRGCARFWPPRITRSASARCSPSPSRATENVVKDQSASPLQGQNVA